MADLPKLSDSTKRKLALQWSTLLDTNGLTGGHLRWHEQELDRLRRIAAQMGPVMGPRWNGPVLHDRAVDEIGIPQTVAVAEARFKALLGEYWRHWLNSGNGYEAFVESLEELKRNVSSEATSIWKGRSASEIEESEDPYDRYETAADRHLRIDLLDGAWFDHWYPRACGPAVEKTLAALVKEAANRARDAELMRLETGAQPKDDSRREAADNEKSGRPLALMPQFPKRASWLKARLQERSWNKHDLWRQGGPDHKTVQKILDGFPIREDVLQKVADGLSRGTGKVTVLDIPQD